MRRPRPQQSGKSGVLRITVDERLDETLVRVLVARPARGTGRIEVSDVDVWQDEKPVTVGPADWPGVFRVPVTARALAAAARQVLGDVGNRKLTRMSGAGVPPRRLCWNGFREGQVYLSGSFVVEERRGEPHVIRPVPGRRQFIRVDRLAAVQAASNALYASALTAGGV